MQAHSTCSSVANRREPTEGQKLHGTLGTADKKAQQRQSDLHGFAEAHFIADECPAAMSERKADALALERHETGLQLFRDARIAGAFVRQRIRSLRHRSAQIR